MRILIKLARFPPNGKTAALKNVCGINTYYTIATQSSFCLRDSQDMLCAAVITICI